MQLHIPKLKSKRFLIYFISFIGILIFWGRQFSLPFLEDKAYYAFFLTNDQVYFGHIKKTDATTIEITDVYYLRTNSNLSDKALQDDETNLHVTLIKLGQEIHGPMNKMFLNRQQILFWEQLREDGRIVSTIKEKP